MKVHIITDTHLGHSRLTEMGVRPAGFTEEILKRLSHIQNIDMLIHLGDFCIGDDIAWHEKFFKALDPKMKKILVRGNHDHKGNAWYISHGWDFVCDRFRMRFNGKDILFSHEPSDYEGSDLNIHGHLHNNDHRSERYLGSYDPNFNRLLAIENTKYRAVDLDYFIRSSTPLRDVHTKELTKESKGV